MLEQISPLWDLFTTKKQLGEPLVLATLVETTGSSYKKAGAMMLIEADRTTHGLLSGGCLEADLAEHAQTVFADQQAICLDYDMSDDSIFGLGAGCDGTLKIILQLIQDDYLPFSALNPTPDAACPTKLCINDGRLKGVSVGSYWLKQADRTVTSSEEFVQASHGVLPLLQYHSPPKIAVCGAGIDVTPLLDMLHLLYWHVTLIDHRPGRINPDLHPARINCMNQHDFLAHVSKQPDAFDAAIIMSHNIDHDATYLTQFNHSDTPWIGLLGPTSRRDRVLQSASIELDQIMDRLHAPIGLNIGGHSPEHIAVAVVAQLMAHFNSQ